LTNPAPNPAPHNDTELRSGEPVQTSALQRVFFGPDGLRAGWSIFLFLVLFVMMIWLGGFIVHRLYPMPAEPIKKITENGMPPGLFFISEFMPLLATLIASWMMSKVEGRSVAVYGFGGGRRVRHFLAGLGWGVVCLSLLVFSLWKTGLLAFDGRLLFGGAIFRYGVLWFGIFLLVALFEESITRGYLQYTLARGLSGTYRRLFRTGGSRVFGFWSSALIFSAIFGLSHGSNPGESPIGMLSTGLIALVLCLSLWRTGSLWWAIGFHASWDWAQSFLYGVADSGVMVQHHLFATRPVGGAILSGGVTGPEGSIFLLPAVALVGLIICFTLPQTDVYAENLPAPPRTAEESPETA
jgi:uncharacterized protein